MTKVKDLLGEKPSASWSVGPDQTVYEALELMAAKNIGAVLVLEGSRLVGIFSERDYARQVILKGRSSRDTRVRDLMTTRLVCVDPETGIRECMGLMSAKHVRHLPVLEKGGLVGIVTIGDVVRKIISEQEITIQDLENYITDQGYVPV